MIGQEDIQGHWRRDWLRAPGHEDATTRVHWMQAGALYADVRIPLHRPDLGDAAALADLSSDALQMLAKAEGFAGTTVVENSVCTWTRAINWHGETSDIDAGKLWFEDGALIEDGVHADYRERWEHAGAAPAEGQLLSGDGVTAYLVTVGDAFVFGAGDPAAPANSAPEALFSRVHAFGRWQGAEGIAVLATNPFLEETVLLTREGEGYLWHRMDFDGTKTSLGLR